MSGNAITKTCKITLFTRPGQERNATVDYLRMIAAIVIVLFHAQAPMGQFGEAAVSVFIVFLVVFSLQGSQKNRLRTPAFVARQGVRLIKPYVVWTLIYMAMFVAQAIIKGQPLFASILKWLPPEGTQRQLWFLPWAFIVCVALNFAASFTWTGLTGSRHKAPLIVVIAILCPACLLVWTYVELPLFFGLFVLYVPSALLGALAFIFRGSFLKLALIAVGSILGAWLMSALGLRGSMQMGIGVPLSILALCIRTPANRWSKHLNQMSMDVFLVHIAALSFIVQLTPFPANTFGGGMLVVAFSIALSLPMNIPAISRVLR